MLTGLALVIIPAFLGEGAATRALAPLSTLGGVLVIGGVVLLWLTSRRSQGGKPIAPAGGGEAALPRGRRHPPQHGSPPDPDESSSAFIAQIPSAGAAPPLPTYWSAAVLDVIEWRRLEALVEALYRQVGVDTRAQSHGADGGVDVWLHAPQAPEKPVGVVQCKHHRKPVGVDKVRELRGVMAAHGVGRGQFFSTAGFTPDAAAFARTNGINTLDGAGLLKLIQRRTVQQQAELLTVATEGEFWRPTCASCGVKMIERTPRGGGRSFWGCGNYPRCRSTLPMRAERPRRADAERMPAATDIGSG
jgi:restriction system protein